MENNQIVQELGLTQEVEFVLLPRDSTSTRVSMWDKYVLPKLRGQTVTVKQVEKSVAKMLGRNVSHGYVYNRMNKWVATGVCKKTSVGAYDEYVFGK